MDLKFEYHIIKPIQLPWQFVSPTESYGLEYHLSSDLSIRIEEIISGEMTFNIGHELIALAKIEVSELDFEHLFLNEILPAKSKERVARACKEGQSTCFFTTPQMEHMQNLFSVRNFMSCSVSVWYKDRKVEDVTQLPPKEFKLVMGAFDDLDVKFNIESKSSQPEIIEAYEKSIKEKAGVLGERAKKTAWQKLKHKNFLKRTIKGIGTVMISITAVVVKRQMLEKQSLWASIIAVLLGTTGIILEAHGRHEIQTCVRHLSMD